MPTISIQRSKNDCYIHPPVPAGDGGDMLKVTLDAPGIIDSIQYSCEGHPCGWVHECPDGGQCGGSYPSAYVHDSPSQWSWYGWTNSGDNCELIFTINYH